MALPLRSSQSSWKNKMYIQKSATAHVTWTIASKQHRYYNRERRSSLKAAVGKEHFTEWGLTGTKEKRNPRNSAHSSKARAHAVCLIKDGERMASRVEALCRGTKNAAVPGRDIHLHVVWEG